MKNKFFVKLLILWFSLVIGAIISNVVLVVALPAQPSALKGFFEYIALAVSLMMIVASQFVYKMLLQKALQESRLHEKTTKFTSAVVVQGALLEAGSILCAMAYFLTGTMWVVGGSLACVSIMLLRTPTQHRCMQELELSQQEVEDLGKM
jgi:hypothetical protein